MTTRQLYAMRQAQHSDGSLASDHRQQAALECAEEIREAIKS